MMTSTDGGILGYWRITPQVLSHLGVPLEELANVKALCGVLDDVMV